MGVRELALSHEPPNEHITWSEHVHTVHLHPERPRCTQRDGSGQALACPSQSRFFLFHTLQIQNHDYWCARAQLSPFPILARETLTHATAPICA